jgi:hypothetical protein
MAVVDTPLTLCDGFTSIKFPLNAAFLLCDLLMHRKTPAPTQPRPMKKTTATMMPTMAPVPIPEPIAVAVDVDIDEPAVEDVCGEPGWEFVLAVGLAVDFAPEASMTAFEDGLEVAIP